MMQKGSQEDEAASANETSGSCGPQNLQVWPLSSCRVW